MQVIAVLVGIALLILVSPLLGALVGAFCGLVVGYVFDESFVHLQKLLGTTAAPYQIGAMLGFIGGFFRSSVSSSK
jgi:hypothetical protein